MVSVHVPPVRVRWWLAVGLVLVVIAVSVLVLAGSGSSAARGDQCRLPVSERTGGWFCPNR